MADPSPLARSHREKEGDQERSRRFTRAAIKQCLTKGHEATGRGLDLIQASLAVTIQSRAAVTCP